MFRTTMSESERTRKRKPTHPGAILNAHYLKPLDLTIVEAAGRLHVSRKTLSEIVNERAAVTSDMALRLSRVFNTTPRLWLNLQQSYDLWRAQNTPGSGWRSVRAIRRAA
jgi:addiction module HigA family antidote